jgi:hypothetical protein
LLLLFQVWRAAAVRLSVDQCGADLYGEELEQEQDDVVEDDEADARK